MATRLKKHMNNLEKEDMYFISRVNYKNSQHGSYWVRFLKNKEDDSEGRQEHIAQRSFTDLKYGGPETALIKAKKWRNKKIKELNIRHRGSGSLYRKDKKKSISSTGIVGVSQSIEKKILVDGGESYFFSYKATWQQDVDGVRKMRSKQYGYQVGDDKGEKLAFEKAKAKRKEMLKLHYL